MKKANLIMLGAPGSGKGTRAVALCEVLNVVQVATGDLFRNNIKSGTELGKLAKSYIDKGELVPDEVTASMVKDRLQQPDTQKGFILDGFPRTIKQAEMLETILKELGEEITAVIFLDVPVEVSLRLAHERPNLKANTKKDIHEEDPDHIYRAYNSGKYVSEKYGWDVIKCTDNGQMKSIEEISELIWDRVSQDFDNESQM